MSGCRICLDCYSYYDKGISKSQGGQTIVLEDECGLLGPEGLLSTSLLPDRTPQMDNRIAMHLLVRRVVDRVGNLLRKHADDTATKPLVADTTDTVFVNPNFSSSTS